MALHCHYEEVRKNGYIDAMSSYRRNCPTYGFRFGDCVEPIEYPIDLTATSKDSLFESPNIPIDPTRVEESMGLSELIRHLLNE